MKEFPYFVSSRPAYGNVRKIKLRTKADDGEIVELEMWDLLNKFGADRVLQMRRELPEIEEDDDEDP